MRTQGSNNIAVSAQESSYASGTGRGKGKGLSDSEDYSTIRRSFDNTHNSAARTGKQDEDVEMKAPTTATTAQVNFSITAAA